MSFVEEHQRWLCYQCKRYVSFCPKCGNPALHFVHANGRPVEVYCEECHEYYDS
jgi:rRNA maturation endonuclease Nob1